VCPTSAQDEVQTSRHSCSIGLIARAGQVAYHAEQTFAAWELHIPLSQLRPPSTSGDDAVVAIAISETEFSAGLDGLQPYLTVRRQLRLVAAENVLKWPVRKRAAVSVL